MKEYVDYMNSIQVSAELHEKIMRRVTHKAAPRLLPLAVKRYVVPAACAAVLAVCILSIPEIPRTPSEDSQSIPDKIAVALSPNENLKTGEERVPGNHTLTLEQAKNDSDFGAYLPASVPSQFKFRSAQRYNNPGGDSLSVIWDETGGDNSICWSVSMSSASELDHLVYAHEREKYDMALYRDPLEESVPEELWECFKNPVFPASELTLETVSARAYRSATDMSNARGWRMAFGVLYENILVRVDTGGATPEQLFEMLTDSVASRLSECEPDYGDSR